MAQPIDRKDESEYSPEEWDAVIEAAAKAGDAFELARRLWRSGALVGLRRRLAARWDGLSGNDIDDVVSQAVAEVYELVRSGKKIRSVLAFLWKVATRTAYATWQAQLPGLVPADQLPPLTPQARAARAPDERDDDRQQALAIARSLVPRLGQQRVQQVMGYWFDALAAGEWDIQPKDVSEALGLPSGIVRTALSRGHRRLKRIAAEAGLHATVDELMQVAEQTLQDDDDRYDEDETTDADDTEEVPDDNE